jgi:hypothetical protein
VGAALEAGQAAAHLTALRLRGLVLILGNNCDDDAANSNGSGKTTLCMAARRVAPLPPPLPNASVVESAFLNLYGAIRWALTGQGDMRATGRRIGGTEVVHAYLHVAANDAVKGRAAPVAEVRVRGEVNGKPFEVARKMSTSSTKAHKLTFSLDSKDVSTLGVRGAPAQSARSSGRGACAA